MPKVEIDYSNTIFYKIFCKDPTIKELYVGLTTNFVQRKHGHKQSCKNEKAPNHNCKLYNAIRNAGGWENWEMEIIAFHNCKDSHEAHKKEQEYFETLGATLNSIEPLPKPKIKKPIVKIIKEKTILFCKPCNIYFSNWKAQETHNNTNKHHKMISMNNANHISIMSIDKTQKNAEKYACVICDFITANKFDYSRHIKTNKHILRVSAMQYGIKSITCDKKTHTHICSMCNTEYKDPSGLWRHKKKCLIVNHQNEAPQSNSSSEDMQMALILELVKQNQEFKNLLIQQSNQMMEQNKTMIEVAKNSQVNNNTINNHSNSHNKTFNLQFFLNETCKDAMNMKDFIKSLELSLPELEKMGEIGFAEGMSRVFVNRLNSLDITKRPIHCSDVKREIIHIKDDNKWEMDNANLDRLRKIIKQLTIKNILKVDDWKKANQGCTEYNSRKNAQYLKINMEAIGPVDEAEVKRDFGKIIRRVAESTAIDKKYLCA
jgi:hypothetical protein